MSMRYRAEIDGLRAVAVGAVIVYHAQPTLFGRPALPGGFLGVDVFFVISGFLITSLIASEWRATGGFSVLHFYERRARRLLPALFAVIAGALPAAWLILLPSQMLDFVKSLMASVFFVSNLFWHFSLQEYGAESGLLQPFLHTWSLAVEEQFYILFPLLYVAGLRRLSARAMLRWPIGIIVAGLALAELLTARDASLSFYGLPSRIWELGAGAALAHVSHDRPGWMARPLLQRTMPLLGLLLVLLPMNGLRLSSHHPGLGTLGTILGTVLIIGFAGAADPVTRLLSSRPFVATGLISYSLYLWHYPIFAFGRHLHAEPVWRDKAVWIGLTVILAAASYRWVEKPFRSRELLTRRTVFWSAGLASGSVCAFAAAMLATGGLRARLPHLIEIYGPNEFDNEILEDATWGPIGARAAARGFGPSQPHVPSDFEADALWFDTGRAGRRVLVVGNSHGKDMYNVFQLNAELFGETQFARFGMNAALYEDDLARLFAAPNLAAADTVLLSFRYDPSALDRVGLLIGRLRARGKQVMLCLNLFEFDSIEGLPVFDWYVRRHGGAIRRVELNQMAWKRRAAAEIDGLNARLIRIGRASGAQILDKNEFVCDRAAGACDVVTSDGYKAFYDDKHFTMAGARYFGRRIHDRGWIDFSSTVALTAAGDPARRRAPHR